MPRLKKLPILILAISVVALVYSPLLISYFSIRSISEAEEYLIAEQGAVVSRRGDSEDTSRKTARPQTALPEFLLPKRFSQKAIFSVDLHLSSNKDHAEIVRSLESLPELVDLSLYGPGVDDNLLKDISRLENLTFLKLARTSLTNEGLQHIGQLRNLTTLVLNETQVSDQGLATIGALQELERLMLYRTEVTDVSLEKIGRLSKLWDLDLRETKITDAGLSHLSALKDLKFLYLSDTQITDPGLLGVLPNLVQLHVARTQVSDETVIAALANSPSLLIIGLDRTPVSEKVFTHLRDHPALKVAELRQSKIPATTIENFLSSQSRIQIWTAIPPGYLEVFGEVE